MAKSHPGYEALSRYLSSDFAWQLPLNLQGEEFSYGECLEALRRLKTTDPSIYKLLAYKWLTTRSRNDIATAHHMDSSTLKRLWNKAFDILVNYLRHGAREGNIAPHLDPIDLLGIINKC